MDLSETLGNVLDLLSTISKLTVPEKLLSIKNGAILTPAGDANSLFSYRRSNPENRFTDTGRLRSLIARLSDDNSLVRLNHIGFCYKAGSVGEERRRLAALVKGTGMGLYEEPSNDEGAWFFIGDAQSWEDMMVELIPVEKTNDPHADYWLPHIHIDIDTNLGENEISGHISSFSGNELKPFPISINGTIYIVRSRLGSIDGVNIMLDLATKSRNVRYQRLHLLRKTAP